MLEIKKGNKHVFEIPVKDQDGVLITNLSSATAIRYMIKQKRDDTDVNALVSKSLGTGITRNDPSTGYVTVTLVPSDTEDLETGVKYHGLEIEFDTDDIKEINLKYKNVEDDLVEILPDVVRG